MLDARDAAGGRRTSIALAMSLSLAPWNHHGRNVVAHHNLPSHLAFSRVAIVITTYVSLR